MPHELERIGSAVTEPVPDVEVVRRPERGQRAGDLDPRRRHPLSERLFTPSDAPDPFQDVSLHPYFGARANADDLGIGVEEPLKRRAISRLHRVEQGLGRLYDGVRFGVRRGLRDTRPGCGASGEKSASCRNSENNGQLAPE